MRESQFWNQNSTASFCTSGQKIIWFLNNFRENASFLYARKKAIERRLSNIDLHVHYSEPAIFFYLWRLSTSTEWKGLQRFFFLFKITKLVLEEHFGGIMIWSLPLDDFNGDFCQFRAIPSDFLHERTVGCWRRKYSTSGLYNYLCPTANNSTTYTGTRQWRGKPSRQRGKSSW